MKTCFCCGRSKPFSEFYKHPEMADGHLGKCKECQKAAVWISRKNNIERIREYDRERSKLPHRVALNSRNTAEYRQKYPKRYKANSAVALALKTGKLVKQPCFMCGETEVEAHHCDYDQPLSVSWLCVIHHRELHLAYPEDHYHSHHDQSI